MPSSGSFHNLFPLGLKMCIFLTLEFTLRLCPSFHTSISVSPYVHITISYQHISMALPLHLFISPFFHFSTSPHLQLHLQFQLETVAKDDNNSSLGGMELWGDTDPGNGYVFNYI